MCATGTRGTRTRRLNERPRRACFRLADDDESAYNKLSWDVGCARATPSGVAWLFIKRLLCSRFLPVDGRQAVINSQRDRD
jgi:hypothetical protein